MPKLSVYVTDELWEKAKTVSAAGGKPNNSQVVQRALEQLLSDAEARRSAFASGAVRDTARIAAIVEQLRDEARQEFERGYAAGLELVEALGFDDLRVTMNAGGLQDDGGLTYVALFSDYEEHPVGEWWRRHGRAFSHRTDDKPDFDGPSEPFCAGAAEALDNVWQGLRANAWGTATDDKAAKPEENTPSERL